LFDYWKDNLFLDRRPIGPALLKKPRDKLGIPVLHKGSRKRKLQAKENLGQKLIKLVTTPLSIHALTTTRTDNRVR
jgi:hypothetical protein